jgi:hypothetical protein
MKLNLFVENTDTVYLCVVLIEKTFSFNIIKKAVKIEGILKVKGRRM